MKKKRNLTLIIGAVLTSFMLLFLLIGFFYTPYDPDAMMQSSQNPDFFRESAY